MDIVSIYSNLYSSLQEKFFPFVASQLSDRKIRLVALATLAIFTTFCILHQAVRLRNRAVTPIGNPHSPPIRAKSAGVEKEENLKKTEKKLDETIDNIVETANKIIEIEDLKSPNSNLLTPVTQKVENPPSEEDDFQNNINKEVDDVVGNPPLFGISKGFWDRLTEPRPLPVTEKDENPPSEIDDFQNNIDKKIDDVVGKTKPFDFREGLFERMRQSDADAVSVVINPQSKNSDLESPKSNPLTPVTQKVENPTSEMDDFQNNIDKKIDDVVGKTKPFDFREGLFERMRQSDADAVSVVINPQSKNSDLESPKSNPLTPVTQKVENPTSEMDNKDNLVDQNRSPQSKSNSVDKQTQDQPFPVSDFSNWLDAAVKKFPKQYTAGVKEEIIAKLNSGCNREEFFLYVDTLKNQRSIHPRSANVIKKKFNLLSRVQQQVL